MASLNVTPLPLAGLALVNRVQRGDARGFLARIFCADELEPAGWTAPIAQVNHSFTARRGAVRGMHFQHRPHAEMKLVSCIRGEVWDVAVDMRQGSPTFLQWHAQRLSREDGSALLIPEGFAHGFQTLSDDVELVYCHSRAYAPDSEGGLHPQDSRLAIDWPLEISDISPRDRQHPLITDEFEGVQI